MTPATPTHFDHLNAPSTGREVRDAYTADRERCPVAHSDLYGGFDYITRYDDVRAALQDSDSYSSADGVFIPPTGLPPVPALDFDEPMHSQWRAVMDPPLNSSAVRGLEPTITEIVDLLIDEFATRGSANLVAELAEPLPAIVVGRMVGLNQAEAVEGRRFAAALFASTGTPAFAEHVQAFTEFTGSHLEARRREPRNDFLTAMAAGEVEGMAIDDDGATGLMIAYLVGGHHSTGAGIAGLINHVLSIDGLRDELTSDRQMRPRVIEESLRMTTPLQMFARTTRCPVDVHGVPIPEGARVMLNLASANRDPRAFDDPETFVARRARNRHVAFGAGTHVCQGQHLARAELRIALGRLLDRIPTLELTEDSVESGLVAGKLLTHHRLDVSFAPER